MLLMGVQVFLISKGVASSREDHVAHADALRNVLQDHDQTHTWIFEHCYRCLDALDAKTGGLLQFNALFIAIWILVASRHLTPDNVEPSDKWILLTALGLSATAVSMSLRAIWVHWTTTAELMNPTQLTLNLLHVRDRRTMSYRRAWIFSYTAFLAMIGFAAQHYVIGPLPNAGLICIAYVAAVVFVNYLYDQIIRDIIDLRDRAARCIARLRHYR